MGQEEHIKYDEAVIRGKQLVEIMQPYQFELGMIADKLEPKYRKHTLRRFADDIGIDYNTLKGYRSTYRAWNDEPSRPKNYSVARVLNTHPRRHELHALLGEDLTVKMATDEMKDWRKEERLERLAQLSDNSDLSIQTKQVVKQLNKVLKDESPLRETIEDINSKDTTTTRTYVNSVDAALTGLIKRTRDVISALRFKPSLVE